MLWGVIIAAWAGWSLAAECPEPPSPLTLPITDTQVDPGVPGSLMRGIPVEIGTPPQKLVVLPWPDLNNTYLYDDQSFCGTHVIDDEDICRVRRGGYYFETESTSFTKTIDLIGAGGAPVEIGTKGSESGIPRLVSTSLAGTDSFAAGGNDAVTIPVGIPRFQWDGGFTVAHALGLGPNSTYLNALVAARKIPSRVWSIFWGRMWTGSADMDGSIVLGGYDQEKVIGRNFTEKLDYSESMGCWTGMKVTIVDVIANFPHAADVSIMSANSAVRSCIVPQRQLLWEAQADIVTDLRKRTGLVSKGGLSSTAFHALSTGLNMTATGSGYDGDLTFVLSSGLRVRVPNNQFIVPRVAYSDDGSRIIDESKKDLLIYGVTGNQPSTLGRYFLTSAYLMVDHDAGTFTMWQGNPSTKSSLVSVSGTDQECDAGSSGDGNGSADGGNTDSGEGSGGGDGGGGGSDNQGNRESSPEITMSTGTIVGAAVGGAAGLACIVALVLFLFCRRRRQRGMETAGFLPDDVRAPYPSSEPKEIAGSSTATELAAGGPRPELNGDYFPGYELHGSALPYGGQGRY
ncbi:aspartic peptidase domain-containing protein [Chaetomium fimeti]|uniref:Aspartic peptidase domain-containing protein n=1 Tax=Chaetomium fimeti TaxID=1854472 RepID=A0AAE0LQ65_9PEZI|nr:aspartic peptidase domain-containing protein [Chaetomium fimeti]